MRSKVFLVVVALAGSFMGAACRETSESKESPAVSTVRLLRSEFVRKATQAPPGLQATIMWPADRELDMYEAGALGDAFLDLAPDWGSLAGASQIETESGGSRSLENSVEVLLVSLHSIEPLRTFCEEHYPNSVVLIHCDADQAWLLSSEQIMRDYGDSGGN